MAAAHALFKELRSRATALSQEMPQEPAWPKKFMVGPEKNNYKYDHLLGKVWKCCKPADGWACEKDDTLFIMKFDPLPPEEGEDTDKCQWTFVAVHAHRETDDPESLLKNGKMVFASEEDILTEEKHLWWYFDHAKKGWLPLSKFWTTHLP
jgi:hypothetical protein